MFWTPSTAHCLELILQDFQNKLRDHQVTIAKCKKITTYIYSRTSLLTCLKHFTNGKELIRSAATRFATTYLTLACLHELKGALITMFSSDKWKLSRSAASQEGKRIEAIVLDSRDFWLHVAYCLRAAMPILKVFRMVDSYTSPSMGFIRKAMDQAKEKIGSNFNNVQKR